MILFTSFLTSKVTARELESTPSLRNEELQWHLPKPHWPFHRAGKALPPLPAGDFYPIPFHPPPVVAKCLSDCKDVKTCFADIAKAFFTHKAAIGSDCCASIKKMNEDCEKTVFGSFHNPFFNSYVKLHCSNMAGSSASAPSPA